MLFVIELIFLFTGIWAIIGGKLPASLFKLLFGKGEYHISPNQTRLFGLLLSSPLPITYTASNILVNSFGIEGIGYAIIFETVYILIVITISIIFSRRARNTEPDNTDNLTPGVSSEEEKSHGYGFRLLIMFSIGILVFITLVSSLTFIGVLISAATVGPPPPGDFWSDIFPFIVMLTIIGIGLFGIFKLAKILRQ